MLERIQVPVGHPCPRWLTSGKMSSSATVRRAVYRQSSLVGVIFQFDVAQEAPNPSFKRTRLRRPA